MHSTRIQFFSVDVRLGHSFRIKLLVELVGIKCLFTFFLSSGQQVIHPDIDAEELRVVRLHDLLIGLSRPLAPITAASGANAENEVIDFIIMIRAT